MTVTLTGSTAGGPIAPVVDVTDAAGLYGFDNLLPGAYTVTVSTATGDLSGDELSTTGGDSQSVTVSSGDSDLSLDFGYAELAAIGDVLFEDLNGNGVQDAGEPGIADVDVTIVGTTPGASHSGGFTIQTGPTGGYAFTSLLPGGYTITVDSADPDMNAAFVSTTGGDMQSRVVAADEYATDVDFGYTVPVSIGDFVFDDLDGDGSFDVGEPGVDGVDVTITGTTPGASHAGGLTVVTVAGFYEFTNLLPGDYDVVVDGSTVPVGMVASSPTTVSGTYESGDDVDSVDFGFVLPVSVGDFVFDDLDGDGSFDAGEPGLGGVTLELSGPGVPVGTTATTTAGGAYSFDGLAPGTYTVAVTGVPAGYTNTLGRCESGRDGDVGCRR